MTDLLEKLQALRTRHEKNKAGIDALHFEIARLKAENTKLRAKLKSTQRRRVSRQTTE